MVDYSKVPSNAEHLNYFIKEYGLQRYLEIGVCGYQDKRYAGATWFNMRVAHKDGVDPAGDPANYHMTSDVFFSSIQPDETWDIIFIDGDHTYAQVSRDLKNSLNHLSDGGFIVMHDVYPHPNLVLKCNPYPAIFSHTWCVIADHSLTRTDLNFYLINTWPGRAIAVIRKAKAPRQLKKIKGYVVGKPINWDRVTTMKEEIFDTVLDGDTYKEFFSVKKESSQTG